MRTKSSTGAAKGSIGCVKNCKTKKLPVYSKRISGCSLEPKITSQRISLSKNKDVYEIELEESLVKVKPKQKRKPTKKRIKVKPKIKTKTILTTDPNFIAPLIKHSDSYEKNLLVDEVIKNDEVDSEYYECNPYTCNNIDLCENEKYNEIGGSTLRDIDSVAESYLSFKNTLMTNRQSSKSPSKDNSSRMLSQPCHKNFNLPTPDTMEMFCASASTPITNNTKPTLDKGVVADQVRMCFGFDEVGEFDTSLSPIADMDRKYVHVNEKAGAIYVQTEDTSGCISARTNLKKGSNDWKMIPVEKKIYRRRNAVTKKGNAAKLSKNKVPNKVSDNTYNENSSMLFCDVTNNFDKHRELHREEENKNEQTLHPITVPDKLESSMQFENIFSDNEKSNDTMEISGSLCSPVFPKNCRKSLRAQQIAVQSKSPEKLVLHRSRKSYVRKSLDNVKKSFIECYASGILTSDTENNKPTIKTMKNICKKEKYNAKSHLKDSKKLFLEHKTKMAPVTTKFLEDWASNINLHFNEVEDMELTIEPAKKDK